MTRRSFLRLLLRTAAMGGLVTAVARRTDGSASCSAGACQGCALFASCELPQRLQAAPSEPKEERHHGRRA